MAWPTRRRQLVMVPGILRRARGLGFLPGQSDAGNEGADWGAWWDSFNADYFTRGWSGFWDGGGGTIEPDYLVPYGGPTTAPLPGYCPPGQYHPIEDPYACIPFPAPTSPARPGPATTAKPATGVTRPKPSPAGACPAPFVFNPKTRKCELPPCPPGQQFSLTQRKCVPVTQITPADKVSDAAFPWWAIIAGGVVLIALTSGRGR